MHYVGELIGKISPTKISCGWKSFAGKTIKCCSEYALQF